MFEESFPELIFVFVEDILQNDGIIISIYSHQVSTNSNVLGYCIEYNLETCKEWQYMNRLHLCSPLNITLMAIISGYHLKLLHFSISTNVFIFYWSSIELSELMPSSFCLISLIFVVQTQWFGAYLFVKKESSKYAFGISSSMKDIEVDASFYEWLQNFTTRGDQAINGRRP